MKLRNKKTGELSDVILVDSGFICTDVWRGDIGRYKTLAELNKDWKALLKELCGEEEE